MAVISGSAGCYVQASSSSVYMAGGFSTSQSAATLLANGTATSDTTFELAAGASITLFWRYNFQPLLTEITNSLNVTLEIYEENAASGDTGGNGPTNAGVYENKLLVNGSAAAGVLTTAQGSVTFTAPKAGTYRLFIWVFGHYNTTGTAGVDSDGIYGHSGVGNTWAASPQMTQQGYLRSGVNIPTVTLSNVSPGGTTPASWAYPDKIFTQATLSQALNAQESAVTAPFSDLNASNNAADKSNTVTVGTTATWSDATGLQLDKNSPASFKVKLGTPSNSALSSQPAFHYSAVTGWTLGAAGAKGTGAVSATSPANTYDQTLNCSHLLRLNSADATTTPTGLSGDTYDNDQTGTDVRTGSGSRLTSDLGGLATRVTNARQEAVTGINLDETIQDHAHLTAAITLGSAQATGTNFGASGWTALGTTFWTAALPGGQWDKTVALSAGQTTVPSLSNTTIAYTLLAINPNYRLIAGIGPATAALDDSHWVPGQPLLFGLALLDFSASPIVLLARNPAAPICQFATNQATNTGTLTVDSTTGFPSSGTLNIEIIGTQSLLALTYTATTANTFTGVAGGNATVLAAGTIAVSPGAQVAGGFLDTDANGITRVYVLIGRFNQTSGNAEYLASDFTWKALVGNTPYLWQCFQSYLGSRVYVNTIAAANTAAFTTQDFEILALAYVNGTAYAASNIGTVVAAAHSHAGLSFNALVAAGVPIT